MRIGVDSGGTFTDFIVLHDDGRLETFKLRSNPQTPAAVILEGLNRAVTSAAHADVVHGSTVATNALLERKGARTAFITTAGFEDILEIGRQNRAELYNLTPAPRKLLAARDLCFGVPERAYFDGTIAQRPTPVELRELNAKLQRGGVESVAICFLHAYQTPTNERTVANALRDFNVSSSHEICPEFREYERASTTFVNAYVRPLMETYLSELSLARRYRISIMQSNGGLLTPKEAARHAVRTVLSGPAGGVIGALETAKRSGFRRILGFDMGGTSTDVSLCDGAPGETTEAIIDGCPIKVPMLDIHTVGAGGGSIARVDAGGLLRVGPESAGANPGPACYGEGQQATVTDAHVVLGRIAAQQLLGGGMTIDEDAAGKAVDRIARALKLSRVDAAAGMIRVANANMERAIRSVSVERGHDPRDFALVAFGGSGGLHACEIAEELDIATVLIPIHAGALSALGMLMADDVRDYAVGTLGRTDYEAKFRALERQAKPAAGVILERSADLRYQGQSYELNIPGGDFATFARAFHRQHGKVYGYATPGRPVEVVTLRVRARHKTPPVNLKTASPSQEAPRPVRRIWVAGKWHRVPVLQRSAVKTAPRRGPALILDYGATTLVPAGWLFQRDHAGNLVLRLQQKLRQ